MQEDLAERIAAGEFRPDLFQRIAGFVVHLPSLAERPEDLMPLARHLATKGGCELHPGCERVLRKRRWPGNVRELKFAVERAVVLVAGGLITPMALAESLAIVPDLTNRSAVLPLDEDVLAACAAHGWHAQRAARALRISRITLWRRLCALGLSLREAKKQGRIVSSV